MLGSVAVGAEGGRHLFRTADGDESIKLLDGKTAEVVLPGERKARRGRYQTRLRGEIHRVEVRLTDGVDVYYRLAPGGLLSERSGKLLRLAPP
jgi:hypothetical protein